MNVCVKGLHFHSDSRECSIELCLLIFIFEIVTLTFEKTFKNKKPSEILMKFLSFFLSFFVWEGKLSETEKGRKREQQFFIKISPGYLAGGDLTRLHWD